MELLWYFSLNIVRPDGSEADDRPAPPHRQRSGSSRFDEDEFRIADVEPRGVDRGQEIGEMKGGGEVQGARRGKEKPRRAFCLLSFSR